MATGKRFYWLKLKKDFFKRHDIRIIESMPNGKDYVLFYLKLMVESIDHEGLLRFNNMIPYDMNMLSVITNTNIDIVRSAMKILQELNLIEMLDDRTIHMSEVQNLMGSETDWAEKKRLYNQSKGGNVPLIEENVPTKEENVSTAYPQFPIRERVRVRDRDRTNSVKKQSEPISLDKHNLSTDIKKVFNDYIEHRKSLKKPMSQRAVDLAVSALNRLGKTEADQIAILEQSIMNGWIGLFELKQNNGNQKQYKSGAKNIGNFDQREYTEDFLSEFYEDVKGE